MSVRMGIGKRCDELKIFSQITQEKKRKKPTFNMIFSEQIMYDGI